MRQCRYPIYSLGIWVTEFMKFDYTKSNSNSDSLVPQPLLLGKTLQSQKVLPRFSQSSFYCDGDSLAFFS